MNNFLDNEDRWGDFFGRVVSRAKRARFDYPSHLDSSDTDLLGVWGDPQSAVRSVFEKNRGFLVQAEGVVFAYNEAGALFVNGDKFEVDTVDDARRICDNRCITGEGGGGGGKFKVRQIQ